MKTVSLVSGGIDSLVMSKFMTIEGDEVLPIFIDYGQLAGEKEWSACQTIFKMSDLPLPTRIDLSGYGKLMPTGITDSSKQIHDQAFLPGRNLLFLVVASSYANFKKANKVAIGLLKDHMFPDQTGEFIVNANIAVNTALNDQITIVTPLINFNKSEVIKLANHYNLPIGKTYSCHSGKELYCKECISCREILNSSGKDLPQFGGK